MMPGQRRLPTNPATPAILAEGLRKTFGSVVALDDVSFTVAPGTILGVLGPNGAGKTTLARILTTSLPPDSGRAEIQGMSVNGRTSQLRRRIGVSGQFSAIDLTLTCRENIELVARFSHLARGMARSRAAELLEHFDLHEVRNKQAKILSGGMRRRLDIACALVAGPEVLFLDEPTTGLDPRSRAHMWDIVQSLAAAGTSILLTTQYLEEADHLADNIVLINNGRLVAEGSPDTLKRSFGNDRLEVRFTDHDRWAAAQRMLAHAGWAMGSHADPHAILIDLPAGAADVGPILSCLISGGIEFVDLAVRKPSLDDVFLSLTGEPT